nr:hypothetical protein [Tanacetum cinerariifolium]
DDKVENIYWEVDDGATEPNHTALNPTDSADSWEIPVREHIHYKKIDGRITVAQLASARDVANNNNVENRKVYVGNLPWESEEGARKAVVDSVKSIDGYQVMCKMAVDGKKGRTGGGMKPSCGPVPGIVNTAFHIAELWSASGYNSGGSASAAAAAPEYHGQNNYGPSVNRWPPALGGYANGGNYAPSYGYPTQPNMPPASPRGPHAGMYHGGHPDYKIVLRVADTYDDLYKPCPDQPLQTASEEDKAAWKAEYKKHNDAVEIYNLVDALHSCKQALGKSVSAYVFKMKGYMDQLHALGKSYDNDMAINLINSVVSGNGVFEIDMNNNVYKNNNNFIFSIIKKRKLDLDSSYLWHCRLAHIGKTRMQKLQREGLLQSINDESFDKCESYISRKMTKKPFNNNIERATDLLGLIHTDVCEPLRHVSRKGSSYFLTFTDDFSRYGYVYLLKHKHEQNGVSERRNRTLLDMVQSMFNLTTLPLSFWDYALEFAVRILNMVPTKKVDKTPYEIWHGKVPNLSYLKVRGCEAYVKRDLADKLHQRSVKSERTMRAPNRLCLNIKVEDDEVGDIGEPANYKAATLDLDKVVRSKWIYKKKTNMDGNVHTYKARLVAKGCTQTYEINYEETFSLVADIRAIRILIAIAAYYDYDIWQMDVKNAFLNGRLDEDIYMEQHEGYVDPKYPNRKYNMHNSKNGYLPMEVKHDLSNELCASTPEEVAYMKKVPYASAVGSIMYAVRCTRPDVEFSQNLVMYRGKPDTELDITGFCDASWQWDKDDTKSQAEYVVASEAAMEAFWIRKFIGDLGVMPSINKPINMYCENSAAIIFANEPGIIKGARHFLPRYHYVRELVETGEFKLIKVHTDDNLADPFTKALPRGMVIDHAKGIGFQLASSFMHTYD